MSFRISTHHFFLLHRLVSSSHVFLWFENQRNAIRISVIFKPRKYSTSTHLAWQHCHGFEFQIRKAKPANCATPSADLWNIDYGMKRYMCCIFVAWTMTYLAQRVARKVEAAKSPMAYAHNVSHSTRNFQILWNKNCPEFSNVAANAAAQLQHCWRLLSRHC